VSTICFHWHGLEESWKLAPSQRTTSLGSLSYLVAFPRNDGTEFSVALVAISKFTLYYSAFCNFSACHKLNQLIDNNLFHKDEGISNGHNPRSSLVRQTTFCPRFLSQSFEIWGVFVRGVS